MRSVLLGILTPIFSFLIGVSILFNFTGHPVVSKNVKILNIDPNGNFQEKEISLNGFNLLSLDVRSVHSGLPFTRQKHLKPCSEYFNEKEELNKALSCANSKVFSKYTTPLKTPPPPKCQVVTVESPDVRETPDFNYINMDLFGKTLAFYDTTTQEIFLVETYDIKMIYRHELQHHFLSLKDGGETCDHCHDMWNQCEAGRYTPTEESIAEGKKKRKGLSIRLIENFYRNAIMELKGFTYDGKKGISKSPGTGTKKVQETGRGLSQILR